MKKLFLVLAVLVLAVAFIGCDNGNNPDVKTLTFLDSDGAALEGIILDTLKTQFELLSIDGTWEANVLTTSTTSATFDTWLTSLEIVYDVTKDGNKYTLKSKI